MSTTQKLWAALYLPALPDPSKDPSRFDFTSREEAMEYVFSKMCVNCQEERRLALAGVKYSPKTEDDPYLYENSTFPACACEWDVVPTEEI